MTKISWKTILGLVLLVAGIVIGYIFKMPVADIVAVAMIIAGAVTSIYDILMKDAITGWKCWLFVVCMTIGVAALTVAGISGSIIESVIGGVVIILDIIFGVIVVKKAKKV
jgi:uncharacterized membrane protein